MNPFLAVVELVAAHTLYGILAGIVLAGAAEILLRWFRGKDSATRFTIWLAILATVVAIPLLRFGGEAADQGVHSGWTLSSSWAWGFLAVWAAIAGISFVRLGFGLLQVQKLRSNCVPVELSQLSPALTDDLQRFGSKRRVELCVSDEISTPTAIGLFRPAVVIPRWAMEELSPEELKTVVLHELAHLERWDDWTNLAQKLCKALFFFHPAVWWIESKLALEREMACDDFVLEQTGNARAYAECLVHLAERSFMKRGLALAQAAVSRVKDTSLRVMQILNWNGKTSKMGWIPATGVVGVLTLVCVSTASHVPSLIAFQDPQPAAMAILPAASIDSSIDRSWMVPAKATEESIAKLTRKKSTAESAENRRVKPLRKPATVTPPPLQVVAEQVQPTIVAPAFMVVMQEQQIGNMRFFTWKVSLVEVVFHPAPAQVKAQNPARAI
jgi:beta-lactamase regulating signal transducer with metallopeptidase domain